MYYRNASGVIIVYSIISQDTFKEAKTWVDEVTENQPDTKIIVVGNMVDREDHREVSKSMAEEWIAETNTSYAKQHPNKPPHLKHMECSAKTPQGINELFASLAHMMLYPDESF